MARSDWTLVASDPYDPYSVGTLQSDISTISLSQLRHRHIGVEVPFQNRRLYFAQIVRITCYVFVNVIEQLFDRNHFIAVRIRFAPQTPQYKMRKNALMQCRNFERIFLCRRRQNECRASTCFAQFSEKSIACFLLRTFEKRTATRFRRQIVVVTPRVASVGDDQFLSRGARREHIIDVWK